MNLRVFFTAVVGSVASSSRMTLTFSPAIVAGQSAMPFLVGMPSAEVGPVSEMVTPIVRSASADVAASAPRPAVTAAASKRIFFIAMSPVRCVEWWSLAESANVFGDRDRAQALGIVGVAAHEGTRLASFADQRLAAPDDVALHEHLGAPLLDRGLDRELFGVGRGGDEAGRDLEQRRADDAARLDQLAPRRDAALNEEGERRRVHPALEVGIEDDAGRIAVAELDRH